jgi:hypothetical protein
MINHFNGGLLDFCRQYMEIFMDMGMLLMGHTLLPLPQFQRLMVRCLVRSITSIQLRIFSLLHQFLVRLKATSSLLTILKSQQLKQILPRQPLTVFQMVLLTVTVELYPLRQANKIHHWRLMELIGHPCYVEFLLLVTWTRHYGYDSTGAHFAWYDGSAYATGQQRTTTTNHYPSSTFSGNGSSARNQNKSSTTQQMVSSEKLSW